MHPVRLRTAHTADLSPRDLDAVRRLCDLAFDDMDDDDFEHALGGIHAVVDDGDELIAHGSVVMRQLAHGDRSLRTGYVEAVAVRPDRQRRGHGATVMDALERLIVGGYHIGALATSDAGMPFYISRGWTIWRGTVSVLGPNGRMRTPEEEGAVMVLEHPASPPLDRAGDLACDWRAGDVW